MKLLNITTATLRSVLRNALKNSHRYYFKLLPCFYPTSHPPRFSDFPLFIHWDFHTAKKYMILFDRSVRFYFFNFRFLFVTHTPEHSPLSVPFSFFLIRCHVYQSDRTDLHLNHPSSQYSFSSQFIYLFLFGWFVLFTDSELFSRIYYKNRVFKLIQKKIIVLST